MFSIRDDQLQTLSEVRRANFRQRAVEHLRKCWPREYNALGLAAVRKSIVTGIERAEFYGIRVERDVIRFIDLMSQTTLIHTRRVQSGQARC